jgi:hypothetical protein
MSNGIGYVVFDYIVTALLWLAVVMQAAVIRDRSIRETPFGDSCRWLIVAGVAGIAMRFTFVLIDVGDIKLQPFSLISLALLCVGLIGRPLEKFMRPPRRRRATDAMEGKT